MPTRPADREAFAPVVLFLGHGFQMVGIYTEVDPAQMIHLVPLRDRPDALGVDPSVRVDLPDAVRVENSV